ncbi:dead end protein 1 [Sander lucioperca]|uniref:DND microRNA-mediated repression inhibitor 1 n=1 Tax=Sander lucioperca TaxID=283035 RepID=A0A8D0A1W4_SANLU|nr:dead end protein 1 [Sander lucioperca]
MESKQSQVLNAERVQALETWLRTTGTKLTQVNGQRKYGGPPEVWDGPAPGARCEVFISQIPRDTYEDVLIPLFSSVGPLWEFRLMMNFSGQNRGFAYGKYGSPAVATEAINLLHGYVVEPGFRLSVRRSTEKRHLCMGNLPAATQQEELLQVLRVLAEGVERLSLKAGPGIEGVSAIVVFSSHHTASMAKKGLVEAFKKKFAINISVKWQSAAKPSPDEQHKLPKSLVPSPVKPPRHILPAQPSGPPTRLARPQSTPLGFCRAVGGPTAPPPPNATFQGPPAPALSPATLLRTLCEANGVGQPLYEIYYSHAGPDGFLYFTYEVCVPGTSTPFRGLVPILPGPTASSMWEEAQRAAAQQVLHRMYSNELAH